MFLRCCSLKSLYIGVMLDFKMRCFWLVSQVHVVKVEVHGVGFEFFIPQGEAPDFEFTPSARDQVDGEIVSQLLLLAFM